MQPRNGQQQLIVVLIAAAIYLTGLLSPPPLMDDVDAAEALQAKNMLLSGDWITQRLNGTLYLDKAPLKYWLTAGLYTVFGIHDWVARIPTAVAAILLCWLVVRIGSWADCAKVGYYAGLVLATSMGLFLFTRTIIPDVILTLFIALTLWCFARLLESETPSICWALGMYVVMACAVLTKGFIGLVFPVSIGFIYLVITRKLTHRETWRRLYPLPGLLVFLAIAAPWHIAAMVRNPPIYDFTLHPGSHFGGKFRGFFWFYFVNEQVLRFLNERWPRDYDTVPRLWFWCSMAVWFLPWTFFLPGLSRLNFKPVNRASRMRLLALCWISTVMIFFTFSTTQEYYSMPIYPAVAILLGSAMATDSRWLRAGSIAAASSLMVGAGVMALILFKVWALPTQGSFYSVLQQHPNLYTLSLGHMADLTMPAFAYLKAPLELAGLSFFLGGLAVIFCRRERGYLAMALTLALFFQAAHLALIVFSPYLSSYRIAEKLNQLPPATLIICGKYNPLSSLFFYARDHALQNERDLDILEYGSLAPGAHTITVSDGQMKHLWNGKARVYVVAKAAKLPHLLNVLGNLFAPGQAQFIFQSGDKYLFANKGSS